MNPNCKWKGDNDLSIKETKEEKKKIQNKFLFTCVLEIKIHVVYIRKKTKTQLKGKLGQTHKAQSLKTEKLNMLTPPSS